MTLGRRNTERARRPCDYVRFREWVGQAGLLLTEAPKGLRRRSDQAQRVVQWRAEPLSPPELPHPALQNRRRVNDRRPALGALR